jgi:Carboxypeptidase regulatory-like domain
MESLRTFSLSIVLLGASSALLGQQITGSIVGNFTDPSGLAVPDVQITVKNEGTGIEFHTRTDASGTYTVPDLLAGVYTVVAAKEGFKTFQTTGVRLFSAQIARQDIALQIGPVQETLKVVAQPQLVQTDSPTIGGTLQTLELVDLPFMTTTMDGLFTLVPGMSQGENSGNANPAIAGAPYDGSSNFTLNGITVNNPGQGGGGNTTYVGSAEMIAQANLPSIDTMQEFKIDSSAVSADQRSQVSVSIVTKQGTNGFHGSAYEYNENKATAATSFDLKSHNIKEYPFNRNQFGVDGGGPILRNRLFFFLDYDGLREVHPQPAMANYPSVKMRSGDFSALPIQLYNPLTGQPFNGNIIPPSMITSQAKNLDAFMPEPTDTASPGLPNESPNWFGSIPLRYGTNNWQGRIDAQLRSQDSVAVFYHQSRGLPWFYGEQGPPNYSNFTNHGYNWINASATEMHTFNTHMINELRAGWVFAYRNKDGQNIGFQPWTIFPGMPASPTPDGGLPTINQAGYRGINDQGLAKGRQTTVDWVDNFTHVKGLHTVKTGFEESGYKEDDHGGLSGQPPLGTFNFSGRWTGNRGWDIPGGGYGQSPGNGYADYLLGFIDETSYGVNTQPYLLSRQWDLYVMDTWKATARLTLTGGVRYIFQRPWIYRYHNASFFDFKNNKLVLAQDSITPTLPPGADPRKFALYDYETTKAIGAWLDYLIGDKDNWGPRVGFAYRLTSDNRTVLRGGYGVYYAFLGDWYGYRNMQSNPPWGSTNSFPSKLPGSPTTGFLPDLTFANAFPTSQIAGVSENPNLEVVDGNLPNPITHQWNLTLERQVGDNWSFRGTYSGSASRHLTTAFNGGYDVNLPAVQQPNVPKQSQRPLQPWSSINYRTGTALTNFHQMQLEIQKRLAGGLMFRTEYDWSRDLTNGNPYTTPQNPHDLAANYGNDPLQYRHTFLIYYVYELPFGHRRRWLADANGFVQAVLGFWQVAGITRYHSGDPITVFMRDPGTKVGWLATWMDRVPGNLYSGRQSRYSERRSMVQHGSICSSSAVDLGQRPSKPGDGARVWAVGLQRDEAVPSL